MYGIISAIPISSCTAERSFSALKRVKTRLRSTMVQERLEGLLLLSVERKTLLTLTKEFIILSPLNCVIVVPMFWLDRST